MIGEQIKTIINDWKIVGLMCLTLGLAPFFPEPHVWGKLKWVIGGAKDMQLLDFADFVWHGLPFVLLIRIGLLKIIKQ